jgi:hypothetical protein
MNEPIITEKILRELDIDFGEINLAELAARANAALNTRVGGATIETLTPDEATKLRKLLDADDRAETNAWIAENVPDYRGIIEDQVDILLADIVENPREFMTQ